VRTRLTIAAVMLVLVAGVTAAWLLESYAPSGSAPAAAAGAYAVRVTRDGRELARFDLAALLEIGSKTVVVQGGTEQGPALLDVLEKAGAGTFASVVIVGPGERDSGRLALDAEDIGPDTVLDIAKRGTVKVAGPNIPREFRVRDITEIQVR